MSSWDIYQHRPSSSINITFGKLVTGWSIYNNIKYRPVNYSNLITPDIESKTYDKTWYRNNENGYQPDYVYDPTQPFPKWIHINYGAIPVVKENFSRWEIDKYDPSKLYIYTNGKLYSTDKGYYNFLEQHLHENKSGFFEDVESFFSKKHNKFIVDRDRHVAFNDKGELVVGADVTTEFIANSKNIPVLFDKFSNIQLQHLRKKWYEDEKNNVGQDYYGRYSRKLTFEEWLVDKGKADEDDFEFPDRSEQDFTDYLGRPVTDLNRPERNRPIPMRSLRSQIKPDKYVYTDSKWSAPIVIMDTETTGLNSSRQLVNIAGIKLRYNFSTQQIGIEDVYERYYMPDWSKGEFKGLNINDAFLKYNDSDAARLTKLFTWQIEHNRRTGHKGVDLTFTKNEQEKFIKWLGGDSIVVGNNIAFDLDFINKGFSERYGYSPTAIDLIQMAQSTSTFRAELDRLIQKEGRDGRLSVPGLMKWFVDSKYTGEQHTGGADVIDEAKIFHSIVQRIQNNPNQYAWVNPNGIRKILEKGSSITSKYVQHPYNVVNTIYEYDEYDNNGKPGTVGSAIQISNRRKFIDDLIDKYKTNIDELSNDDVRRIKKELMTKSDKELIEYEHAVNIVGSTSNLMSQGYSSGAVNFSDNYENRTESKLDANTFSNVYMPTVYKSYLGKNNKGKSIYKNVRASMLSNVSDDEDLSDVKYGGIEYIDESNWTVDKYNPEENLYRMGVNGTSYSSWKDITEFSDAMYETPDETGLRAVRAWRESIPKHLKNEVRYNLETHKFEVKMHQLTLQRIDNGGRFVEYTYDYSRVDSGLGGIVSERVYKYGDTIEVDGKQYKVVESKSAWEVNMKNNNLQQVKQFLGEMRARQRYGFVGLVSSDFKKYRDIALSLNRFAGRQQRPVKDIDERLQKFVDEQKYMKKKIEAEYKFSSKIASDRRNVESQLSSLVSNKVMSRGDADFINNTYNAEIDAALDEGNLTAERYAEILGKVNDRIAEATEADKKRIDTLEKSAKLLKKISPLYDFNNIYQAGYAQINGVIGAAGGVLPRFAMQPIQRAGAALINGFEVDRARYNYYMRAANTAKGVLAMGGHIAGAVMGGPIGSAVGYMAGAGLGEVGVAATNMWLYGKERRITETGNLLQNSFNTVGFLKSISGLDVAFSVLTKTVKWATLGFIGMITKGLHSMQSLGNPITQLSGVNYANYQVYGRMDRMFGFSNGTINSSIENFALQQRRMYTYGQMDIDRVVAASMLGVFGNVYANGGDPKANYEATVNKIASGGITDTKLSWAAMIDKTLPQILQIMKDMDARTLSDVYRQSGVTFNELTDEERKKMRRVSFGYRTSLSNISTSWQRMGASLWEGGLNKVFDRVGKWIETIAQNADIWMGKINPLIDAFDNLFKAFRSGDKESIERAIDNIKKEFGKAFDVLKEPIARMVSGISVAMLTGMQTMLPSISKMIQSLIGEIGKFNFDKDALMSNINNGTNFPIIRYGEQLGQFQYYGKNKAEAAEFYRLVDDYRKAGLSTEQINSKLLWTEGPNGNVRASKFRGNFAHTDDYTPMAAISAAQTVIDNESNRIQEGEMFKQFYTAMMKAFESFGLTINLKDDSTGNTRKLDGSTSLGAYAIQKAVSNQ